MYHVGIKLTTNPLQTAALLHCRRPGSFVHGQMNGVITVRRSPLPNGECYPLSRHLSLVDALTGGKHRMGLNLNSCAFLPIFFSAISNFGGMFIRPLYMNAVNRPWVTAVVRRRRHYHNHGHVAARGIRLVLILRFFSFPSGCHLKL